MNGFPFLLGDIDSRVDWEEMKRARILGEPVPPPTGKPQENWSDEERRAMELRDARRSQQLKENARIRDALKRLPEDEKRDQIAEEVISAIQGAAIPTEVKIGDETIVVAEPVGEQDTLTIDVLPQRIEEAKNSRAQSRRPDWWLYLWDSLQKSAREAIEVKREIEFKLGPAVVSFDLLKFISNLHERLRQREAFVESSNAGGQGEGPSAEGSPNGPELQQHPAVRLGLEERMIAFHAALRGEDELGAVVRAHLYIEHELIEFIRARMSPPEALDAIELDFDGRVKLAVALGLNPTFKPALRFVGSLRNRFAHRLEMVITKQEADNLGNAMGPNKAVAVDAYQATSAKFTAKEMAIPVSDRDPRDRVTLYLITLWGGIAVAAAQARERERA